MKKEYGSLNIVLITACSIDLVMSVVIGFHLYWTDKSNFDISSFLGAIIGFCGIGITIAFSNIHSAKQEKEQKINLEKQLKSQKEDLEKQLESQKESLEKQLKIERKNSFDSAVALENYKNYMEFAKTCTRLSFDSRFNIELCDNLNENNFNEFKREINEIFKRYANCYKEYKDYVVVFITTNQYADNKNKTNKNIDIVSKLDFISKLRDVTNKIFAQLVSLIENDKEKEAILFFEKNKNILKESFKQESQIYLSTSSYISNLANELIK